ncbi:hypothetical protein L0156_02170 [bacterium]|nr:hypothetical protein [bacterium]
MAEKSSNRCVILLLSSFLLFQTGLLGENPGRGVLSYGIVGSETGEYSSAMGHPQVQQILLDIAREPRDKEYLDQALQGSTVGRKDLKALGLIRFSENRYTINFTLFTREDLKTILRVSEAKAEKMTKGFLGRKNEIESILSTDPSLSTDRKKELAFILLGCFSLDWDGLRITADKGYRYKPPKDAMGNGYVPWAQEKDPSILKGLYWGSHNEESQDVVITSFGDHHSLPRYTLPDLLWAISWDYTPGNLPDSLKPSLHTLRRAVDHQMWSLLGRIMFGLEKNRATSLNLASSLHLPPRTSPGRCGFSHSDSLD